MEGVPAVAVGPFRVADATHRETVDRLVDMALTDGRERLVTGFALHVGGLNAQSQPEFVDAMNNADFVYADGGSVVWLARRAGGTRVERAPTTDIGWDVLRGIGVRLGTPPKVALVGGRPGLARVAAAALEATGVARPVMVQHGYHQAWHDHVRRLRAAEADVILVGMGVPTEMLWTSRWAAALGTGLLLTCGGWFGFLAAEERRAPILIRRPGLEWIGRVAQQPMRLGPRYFRGAIVTATLAHQSRRYADGVMPRQGTWPPVADGTGDPRT